MRMRNMKYVFFLLSLFFNKLNLLHSEIFVFSFIGVLVETKQFLQERVSFNNLVTHHAPQMLYCD